MNALHRWIAFFIAVTVRHDCGGGATRLRWRCNTTAVEMQHDRGGDLSNFERLASGKKERAHRLFWCALCLLVYSMVGVLLLD